MLLKYFLSCFKCNIKISQILQQNAITVQWKEIFARFHCTIMKIEISILYHVILNSQLNRDNLTRCYNVLCIVICIYAVHGKTFYSTANMAECVFVCKPRFCLLFIFDSRYVFVSVSIYRNTLSMRKLIK